jgi:hypothetical protein
MIYTPRVAIEMLRTGYFAGAHRNPCVCTKIPYKGYEISISMDSSHGDGDLHRTDIRVFTAPGSVPGVDCTVGFLREDENMLYGDGETLLRVMQHIDELVAA